MKRLPSFDSQFLLLLFPLFSSLHVFMLVRTSLSCAITLANSSLRD